MSAGGNSQKENLASTSSALLHGVTSVSFESIVTWLSHVAEVATPDSPHHSNPSAVSFKAPKKHSSDSIESSAITSKVVRKRQRKSVQVLPANMAGRVTEASLYPCTPTSNSNPSRSGATRTPTNYPTSTDSPIPIVSGLKWGKSAYQVGIAMTDHGLFHNDRDAFDRYPEFKSMIRSITADKRNSTMKPQSIRKFQERQDYYERLNEDTVLHNLLPLIIKDDYTRSKAFDEEKLEMLKEAGHSDGEWFHDGVVVTMNNEFRKTLVPNRYANQGFERFMADAMAKADGMKNPKPDYMYGIRRDKFRVPDDIVIANSTNALLEIAPGMHHPFLIVEGKSDQSSNDEAENQARRGGATLVNAARQLRFQIEADPAVISGVDDRSFVFSCTMIPKMMEIWVHWCEVMKDTQYCNYHMNKVASQTLSDEAGLVALRRTLHNILEWGCITRYKDLEKIHESLHDYERRQRHALLVAATESNASKTSAQKRKKPDSDTSSLRGFTQCTADI